MSARRIEPRRAGWGLAVIAAAMLVAGRVFGLVELAVLGTGAVVAAVAAGATLRRAEGLRVDRRLSAGMGPRGSRIEVQIHVTNTGERRSPATLLRNPTSTGEFRARLGPLLPGEAVTETYGLQLRHRGILRLDAVTAEVTDPLGLATVTSVVSGPAKVLVVPRVRPVAPVPRAAAPATVGNVRSARLVPAGQGEFHSLRDWRDGDELRSVHWRSSLRTGHWVVREDEATPDGYTAVILDVDARSWADHTPEALDAVLDAAASVAAATLRAGQRVRVVDGAGGDTGFGLGVAHLDRILADLAVLQPTTDADPGAAMAAARHAGAVVVVTPRLVSGAASVAAALAIERVVGAIVAATTPSDRVPTALAGEHFPTNWARVAGAMERMAT